MQHLEKRSGDVIRIVVSSRGTTSHVSQLHPTWVSFLTVFADMLRWNTVPCKLDLEFKSHWKRNSPRFSMFICHNRKVFFLSFGFLSSFPSSRSVQSRHALLSHMYTWGSGKKRKHNCLATEETPVRHPVMYIAARTVRSGISLFFFIEIWLVIPAKLTKLEYNCLHFSLLTCDNTDPVTLHFTVVFSSLFRPVSNDFLDSYCLPIDVFRFYYVHWMLLVLILTRSCSWTYSQIHPK